MLQFDRDDGVAGNLAPALEMLEPLIASRENAELFEGRITFFFAGWGQDPRETAAILEIRR